MTTRPALTVAQLIAQLSQYPSNATPYFADDDGNVLTARAVYDDSDGDVAPFVYIA